MVRGLVSVDERSNTLLKRLIALITVLLIAAVMAAPALAQQVADAGLYEWGSSEWLSSHFGDENGDLTEFCLTAGQTPETQAAWTAQFPGLASECGWSVEEG